ncbi:hypothetical protein [Streptomyces sp. NPDC058330]|uniref:hypothetical protein n=1 Tax=Streptomyces sp. NPDC058330 TaxID=3346449 RepID=UPI0036EB4335
MITHTMLVSFADPISDSDLDQFVSDIEKSMRDTGVVETFSARHHIPVPGEEVIPAFIATAVLQFGVADRDALVALFAAPGQERSSTSGRPVTRTRPPGSTTGRRREQRPEGCPVNDL